MLQVILEIRHESEYLAGFDPVDPRIQGLRAGLDEIPKGSALPPAVNRLAARLQGILAGAAKATPDDQAQPVEPPPTTTGSPACWRSRKESEMLQPNQNSNQQRNR